MCITNVNKLTSPTTTDCFCIAWKIYIMYSTYENAYSVCTKHPFLFSRITSQKNYKFKRKSQQYIWENVDSMGRKNNNIFVEFCFVDIQQCKVDYSKSFVTTMEYTTFLLNCCEWVTNTKQNTFKEISATSSLLTSSILAAVRAMCRPSPIS